MTSGIVESLINELMKLPGIGRKSAQRLALFMMKMSDEDANSIANAIIKMKERARFCNICFNITEDEVCSICRDPLRDKSKICVVEEPGNLIVIERAKTYRGLYHVLLGALSPIDGVTPDKLKINELLNRVKTEGAIEIIIATNPNTNGETTAQYLLQVLKPFQLQASPMSRTGMKITRIAYGLPIGGDIEFADEVTISKAIEGRREM